jgi:hypothetical protein
MDGSRDNSGLFRCRCRHDRWWLDDLSRGRRDFYRLLDNGLGNWGRLFGNKRGCRGPGRFHQARRRERRRSGLGGLLLLQRRRRLLCAGLHRRALGEHVAAGQRNAALFCQALDELVRHDLFDRARRAFQLDTVRALQQRKHFLAARVEKFRDFINTNGCQ